MIGFGVNYKDGWARFAARLVLLRIHKEVWCVEMMKCFLFIMKYLIVSYRGIIMCYLQINPHVSSEVSFSGGHMYYIGVAVSHVCVYFSLVDERVRG